MAKSIHCPVDVERFTGNVHTNEGMNRLLYVGRLAEDKGVMTALKAMHAVKGKFAGELHVDGRGDEPCTRTLHSYVAEHRLPVHFHEATAEQMPDVYRRHDALLFTSEWEEPFALTPLEAMACGLPVIGTTTGGSKELFRCGSNALTYTAGNHHELAARIVQLDNSRALRNCLAVTGQREVRTRLHQDLIVSQIEDYLRRCLREKQARLPNPLLLEASCMSARHLQPSTACVEPSTHQSTLDGSDELELLLENVCSAASEGIRHLVPKTRLEGLALGGGYGRGEGGVLRESADRDQPYNDIEFFIFISGHPRLNERRYGRGLHELAHRLTELAGIEVEFKVLSLAHLAQSETTMFYHDLVMGHRGLAEQTRCRWWEPIIATPAAFLSMRPRDC